MKKDCKPSLSAYWQENLRGTMGRRYFYNQIEIWLQDEEIAEAFGKYRARKLTEKQIEMLDDEFIK